MAALAGRRGVIAEAGKVVPGFLDLELMWLPVWTCMGSWSGPHSWIFVTVILRHLSAENLS